MNNTGNLQVSKTKTNEINIKDRVELNGIRECSIRLKRNTN